ncbi:MAG: type I restriction endonuclease, partial [Dehalococcoidia bacterium]
MTQMNEKDARAVVDELLRRAGWDPKDGRYVGIEVPIAGGSSRVAEAGVAYRVGRTNIASHDNGAGQGRADYVLWDGRGNALAIIEAKGGSIDPYTAKQQALHYARQLGAPFIFLTNGSLIYFWDYGDDDARIVDSFFSRRDLERLVAMRAERRPLATVPIPEHYIRQS